VIRVARARPAAIVVKCAVAVAALILAGYLVWGLRRMIVPASVGALLAHICRPLVARLERWRIPRVLAIGLLLLVFALVALVGLNSIRAIVPNEMAVLELRVRALYVLHHRYQAVMGLGPSWTGGNRLYRLANRDLDPLVDRVSALLALTPEERAQLVESEQSRSRPASIGSKRLVEYERVNARVLEIRARPAPRPESGPRPSAVPSGGPAPTSSEKTASSAPDTIVSTWMIAPVIFLFLLADTGSIKRGLLRAVPNRLFEPALAVLADVDEALGNYVRGIFLECCSLGVTVIVFITLVGVPLRWAIAIGIFAGASNTVPYMGFAAALLSGLAYALLAENVHPLLPFVTVDTFVIWVVVAVTFAELIKNVVYEPIVLGGAVKLHPIVVVLGVVGGAILFGPAGMFLAIPTITVARVLVASGARHLTAYGVI
jgi:predicted PurR-regulated permease PerM